MSRHPDNPYWCQVHDHPHPISRADWDAAVASGHVTLEHLLARIEGMWHHAQRTDGPVGYDADGFIVSLTAAGIRMCDSIRIDVRTNDHNPPHAHIAMRGEPGLNLRINIETATIMDDLPDGMSRTGRRIERFVKQNQGRFLDLWATYQGASSGP